MTVQLLYQLQGLVLQFVAQLASHPRGQAEVQFHRAVAAWLLCLPFPARLFICCMHAGWPHVFEVLGHSAHNAG